MTQSGVLRVAVARGLYLSQDSACIVSHISQEGLGVVHMFSSADVSSDQDQVLYATCTASEPGSGVCGATVPDFLLNQPLCSKHITKTVREPAQPAVIAHVSVSILAAGSGD